MAYIYTEFLPPPGLGQLMRPLDYLKELFVRRPQLSENVFDKPLQAGIEMAFEFVGMRWDDPFRLLVGMRWDGLSLPLREVAAMIARIPARLVPGMTSAVGTSVAEGAGGPASG
jgi:hypothetical protein